jgi:hypothetical protein
VVKSAIKIKVDRVTPRIQYTLDFAFKDRGIAYELILDDSAFDFDYTQSSNASYLLYSENLEVTPGFNEEHSVFVFEGKEDPLASIFYVLSRMEEYTVPDKDLHDRFAASQSTLVKYGLIHKAICDRWAEEVLKSIDVAIPNQIMGFEPTFDIDNTFAYKYKRGFRRKLSVLRDRLRKDSQRLKERKEVERGGKDPYDTFHLIRSISERFNTRIFWLVESHGKYDRNLDVTLPQHQSLIQKMAESAQIGIHPSYKSFCSPRLVSAETNTLAQILGSEIETSRQHFLRCTLPETFRVLLEVGIRNDFTMGFADDVGFRLGTARSVQWYDLLEEKRTDLTIHPFVYMDGTLNEYLKLSPEQAKEVIKELYVEVHRYGGTFRFIWHNETIGGYNHWEGWESVLEYTLNLYNE